MYRKPLIAVSLLCAVMATGALVEAADCVLDVIPDDALAVVVINNLDQTDAKIVALAGELQLPPMSPLGLLKLSSGVMEGVDGKGSAALALMSVENARPPVTALLFLPVTDFKKFTAQLAPDDADAKIVSAKVMGSPLVIGSKDGYAVLAEAKHRDVLQKTLESSKSVADALSSCRATLAESDIAFVATRSGIQLAAKAMVGGLRQAKAAMAKMPEEAKVNMEMAIASFNVYEKIIKTIGDELEVYASGIRIAEDGTVVCNEEAQFSSGGHLAKMLEGFEPVEGDLLAGLPARPFIAAGGGVIPEAMGQNLLQLSLQMMKAMPQVYGLDEQQMDRLAEISADSMKGIQGMSLMLGVGEPGDSLYSNMAVVMKVDDAEAYVARYKKLIKAMNELVKDAENSLFKNTKLRETKLGDTPVLQITVQMPKMPGTENIPNYDKMMEFMVGPGGKLVAYMAIADEHTLVAAYTKKRLLRKCLRAVAKPETSLSADENVIATAALLPSGAQCIGFWSIPGTIQFANRTIAQFAPPEKQFQLPEFPATPPIGCAMKVDDGHYRGSMVIPAEVIQAIGPYVGKVKAQFAPAAKSEKSEGAAEL